MSSTNSSLATRDFFFDYSFLASSSEAMLRETISGVVYRDLRGRVPVELMVGDRDGASTEEEGCLRPDFLVNAGSQIALR